MTPAKQGETRPSQREGIGLCLSGGGFRASIFHIGALRRLHELGILGKTRTVSSVSGGSILSGFLANQMRAHGIEGGLQFSDWESQVAAPFRRFVSRDLRTWPILAHAAWNWLLPGLRVNHLIRLYRRRLTERQISELPPVPEFVFCASDLTFGVNWEFRRERSGDYEAGYAKKASGWPLARAVAASACFPPIFGPMPVNLEPADFTGGAYAGAGRAGLLKSIKLSDGGVYDNMGIEPVWRNHAYVLVSDCGAPFQFRPATFVISTLARYTGVVQNQALALRKRLFFSDLNEGRYRGAYWALNGSTEKYQRKGRTGLPGYPPALVAEVINPIRTDLDGFTEAEICVLENHGYLLAEASVARRVPEIVVSGAPDVKVPHPDWMSESLVRKELASSGRRLSLKRLLKLL